MVPKRKKKATSTSGTSGKRPSLALSYSIPENLKKRIISGQFVPLYKLLPGYASGCTSTISSVTEEDGSVKLRLGDSSKDRKLSRQSLTFPQVILSLLKFKVILCNCSSKSTEFIDSYVSNLTLISNKYSNTAYWAYHLYFWDKALEFVDKSISLDWSILDAESLHAAIAQQCTTHFISP